jgi:putative oxidoreductase
MKIATTVSTYLVGLVYTVFGLNGFLHFIPMPPMSGDAGAFAGILMSTGFMQVVKIIEIICGVMLLANFKRPLAYILIAPITVCILLFEILIAKTPGIGIVLTALVAFGLYSFRDRFWPIVA